ncbi:hypothetical protein BC834DRAFT_170908 [Gloeopeniophorella convolvens]|nr:hypothetical protein BC834DRAFT_170908 [Gloeopeniophorella convolvens]
MMRQGQLHQSSACRASPAPTSPPIAAAWYQFPRWGIGGVWKPPKRALHRCTPENVVDSLDKPIMAFTMLKRQRSSMQRRRTTQTRSPYEHIGKVLLSHCAAGTYFRNSHPSFVRASSEGIKALSDYTVDGRDGKLVRKHCVQLALETEVAHEV